MFTAYLLICSVAFAPDLACTRDNALAIIPLRQSFETAAVCEREAAALVNTSDAFTLIDHALKLACEPR